MFAYRNVQSWHQVFVLASPSDSFKALTPSSFALINETPDSLPFHTNPALKEPQLTTTKTGHQEQICHPFSVPQTDFQNQHTSDLLLHAGHWDIWAQTQSLYFALVLEKMVTCKSSPKFR